MKIKQKHKIQEVKLSSGAKLFNIVVPDFSVSVVSAWFRAGSRFDPVGKEGLAHFFEHLMMIRTDKYPDRRSRIKALESKGISFNAFTTNELSYYYQTQLPDQLYDSLDFLIDGLSNSQIDKSDVKREKAIILNEESQNRSNPADYIWRLGRQGLWPDSDFGRDFFGDQKTINNVSISDIIDFKDRYYVADNLVFVVVGSEPIGQIKKYIEKKYQPTTHQKHSYDSENSVMADTKKINIEKRDTDQLVVSINYRTTSIVNLKEMVVLDFIKNYMASTWISRLIDRLRIQKNLTYWVEGNSEYFSDRGYLGFDFSIDPKKVNQALKISFEEIEKLRTISISKKDLVDHKTSYKSSLIRRFTDPYEIMWWYGHVATLNGQAITLDEYIKLLDSLTSSDIRSVSNKFLVSQNLSLSFVGPVEDSDIRVEL